MLIYLAMTTLCCLIAFFATKEASTGKNLKIASFKISYSAIFLILSAIPMIFVSGLRWETGVDHQNYYWVFTNILYGLNTHVEIGFKLLCKAILLFTENMSVMFFVCTVITITFTMFAIKMNSKNYFISVFLYISMGFFYYSMNSIRHYIALSIYMFAYYFMRKRKFIPYVLLVLLAASFHKIALIAIPLYFLLNIKYKAYWYGIGAAVSLLLAVFHRQILDFVYNYAFTFYKAIEKENTGYSLVNIGITLALSILAFIYQKKLLDKDKKNIILINSAYLGLIFFAFFGWVPVYTRIGQYMTILSLFLIPKIIDCEDNIKIKNVYKIGLIVGFSAFMIIMLINAKSETIKLLPYKNILFDF